MLLLERIQIQKVLYGMADSYKYSYKCNHYGSDLEEDPWFDITIIDNQYYIKLKDSYRGSSVEFEIIARGEYPVYYQCSNYGTEAEYMEYRCEGIGY